MIKAKNLNFSYDKDKTFINNLNVEIEKGKVTTILGQMEVVNLLY